MPASVSLKDCETREDGMKKESITILSTHSNEYRVVWSEPLTNKIQLEFLDNMNISNTIL